MYIEPETVALIWAIFGIVLILLELLIPGAVVAFFGVGALIVAAGTYYGFLEGFMAQILCWSLSSILLILLLRRQICRIFPAIEFYKPYDESADIKGRIVTVLQDVHSDSDVGRVRYQGSSWKAISRHGTIAAGSSVKITGRENLILYVERTDSSKE